MKPLVVANGGSVPTTGAKGVTPQKESYVFEKVRFWISVFPQM